MVTFYKVRFVCCACFFVLECHICKRIIVLSYSSTIDDENESLKVILKLVEERKKAYNRRNQQKKRRALPVRGALERASRALECGPCFQIHGSIFWSELERDQGRLERGIRGF